LDVDQGQEVVDSLERQMMTGKGRWVADFNESFRDYRVGDVTFDVFISGNTRMKGFVLSRLYSFFLNPNYEVGFFAIRMPPQNQLTSRRLRKWILAVKASMRKAEMKWAWLTILGDAPDDSAKQCVREAIDSDVGIAYVDLSSREIIASETYLGRQLKRYIRL
jgi:hypothetical protein